MKILIIGAGWAGLSAAIELCPHHEVTVIEAAAELGGRARAVQLNDIRLDNGQHLLLGAYQHLWQLLLKIGVKPHTVTHKYPLSWYMADNQGKITSQLHTNRYLPAPLHLIAGVLSARGLSWRDKKLALTFCQKIKQLSFHLEEDCSVASLLQHYKQSSTLIEQVWQPLCIAALTTPIASASSQVFLRTLQKSFTLTAQDSEFMLAQNTLAEILPEPARHYITRLGGQILPRTRAIALEFKENTSIGARTKDTFFAADHIILATSPYHAAPLLNTHPKLIPLQQTLCQFQPSPITTVYLQYDKPITANYPVIGLHGTTAHWLFTKTHCQSPHWVAAVISGAGDYDAWDHDTLISTVHQEASRTLNKDAKLQQARVIREKSGAFLCTVASNKWRPSNATPLPNLWLAGDYTNTELPATLESAVQSGVACAEMILSPT